MKSCLNYIFKLKKSIFVYRFHRFAHRFQPIRHLEAMLLSLLFANCTFTEIKIQHEGFDNRRLYVTKF